MAGYQFPRSRRLKRRRLIRPLFDGNKENVGIVKVGAVLIRYKVVPRTTVGADVPIQIGFASGGRLRTKVVRNRIRRVMRESFRLNQLDLVEIFGQRADCLTMMALFRGPEDTAADDIRRDFPEALKQLEGRFGGHR